jgi:hypothetical protein
MMNNLNNYFIFAVTPHHDRGQTARYSGSTGENVQNRAVDDRQINLPSLQSLA